MDKREFLKTSGALVAGSRLPHVLRGQDPTVSRENWAGNITYSTDHLLTPGSVDEVRQAVKSTAKLRALGTRHSFNTIADSRWAQIPVKRLDQMTIDEKAKTVTVGAGVLSGKLAPYIDERGYSLQTRPLCLTSPLPARSPLRRTVPGCTIATLRPLWPAWSS